MSTGIAYVPDVAEHPATGITPTKRLVSVAEAADATDFLLRNTGVNAHDLVLNAGMIIA